MLSDRPYMRGDYPRERTSIVTWLLASVLGAFVLEFALFSPWVKGSDHILGGLAVTFAGITGGWIWTLFTHGFLHSQDNLFHVGIVLAGIYLLGRELEAKLGPKQFIGVFFGAVAFGAVMWSATHWRQDGMHIGGTAGIYGLITVFAALNPNRELKFLMFFFFPLTFKPKHVVLTLLAVELVAFACFEVLGRKLPFDYAASAHLGGIMVGWVFYRYILPRDETACARAYDAQRGGRVSSDEPAEEEFATVELSPVERRAHLRVEVDRILDKINSHGLTSLTLEERQRLDEAKKSLLKP
jgi:membrane associated rhomboid family serine protease